MHRLGLCNKKCPVTLWALAVSLPQGRGIHGVKYMYWEICYLQLVITCNLADTP